MKVRRQIEQNDDALLAYFGQIRTIPLLSFEEELELAQSISEGDELARRRLIEANLRLVVKIARSYYIPDVSFLDLIQEGNMGLMHAADKYDPLKQVRFSTYASWWIRQTITRYLANKRRTIRLPHRKEEILRKIQRAYHTLSQLYMRQPRTEEIAQEIGVSLADVEFILGITNGFLPLDVDRGNSEESTAAMDLHEDYTYSPERALMRKSSREATIQILKHLKDREKRIIIYRYQLNGGKRRTLKSIGDKMGISPETVRQIELRALQKIRIHADELRLYVDAI
jgi:RNA polymerase primary sigma factor